MKNGPARQVVAIFCEDLRQETGGKSSLMGVLLENLFFSGSEPYRPARLCVVFFFRVTDQRPNEILLRVTSPNGEPLVFSPPIDELFGPTKPGSLQTMAQVNVLLNGIEAASGSTFCAEAIIDGIVYHAGQLTVSASPSGQMPTTNH
jgi:hypothetical protein